MPEISDVSRGLTWDNFHVDPDSHKASIEVKTDGGTYKFTVTQIGEPLTKEQMQARYGAEFQKMIRCSEEINMQPREILVKSGENLIHKTPVDGGGYLEKHTYKLKDSSAGLNGIDLTVWQIFKGTLGTPTPPPLIEMMLEEDVEEAGAAPAPTRRRSEDNTASLYARLDKMTSVQLRDRALELDQIFQSGQFNNKQLLERDYIYSIQCSRTDSRLPLPEDVLREKDNRWLATRKAFLEGLTRAERRDTSREVTLINGILAKRKGVAPQPPRKSVSFTPELPVGGKRSTPKPAFIAIPRGEGAERQVGKAAFYQMSAEGRKEKIADLEQKIKDADVVISRHPSKGWFGKGVDYFIGAQPPAELTTAQANKVAAEAEIQLIQDVEADWEAFSSKAAEAKRIVDDFDSKPPILPENPEEASKIIQAVLGGYQVWGVSGRSYLLDKDHRDITERERRYQEIAKLLTVSPF